MLSKNRQSRLSYKERLRILYIRYMVPLAIRWNWRSEIDRSVKTEDFSIDNVSLKLRVFYPPRQVMSPVIVYFHGGGFMMGGLDASDPGCRDLCKITGMVIVSVGYRLAPENPFPAAVDDSLAAFDWVMNNIGHIRGDRQRVFIAGDSAGGNLATVVAQQRRSHPVLGQVLLYPVVDFSNMDRPSYQQNTDDMWLNAQTMRWFRKLYFVDERQWVDVRASPLLADSLEGLPPALILTAEFDPLRDEAELYARNLAAAGVDVEHHRFNNEHHGFYGFFGKTLVYHETATVLVNWLAQKAGNR